MYLCTGSGEVASCHGRLSQRDEGTYTIFTQAVVAAGEGAILEEVPSAKLLVVKAYVKQDAGRQARRSVTSRRASLAMTGVACCDATDETERPPADICCTGLWHSCRDCFPRILFWRMLPPASSVADVGKAFRDVTTCQIDARQGRLMFSQRLEGSHPGD